SRGREPKHVEAAHEVQLDGAPERVEVVRRAVAAERARRDPAAAAVHADREPAARGRELDRRRYLGLGRDVAANEAIGAPEVGRDRTAPLLRDVGEDHVGARRVQPPSGGLTETRGRAGYERDVAGN